MSEGSMLKNALNLLDSDRVIYVLVTAGLDNH